MSIPVNELRIGNWVLIPVNRDNLKDRPAWRPFENEGYEKYVVKRWKEIVAVRVESIYPEGDSINIETEWGDSTIRGEYEFEPIPLTPEILEKCGFKESEYGRLLSNGRFDMLKWVDTTDSKILAWCFYNRLGKPSVTVYIPYLHDFQNLYFALVGEELTVNLTEYQTA